MPRLARNRRLMYAFAAVRNLGNSVTAIFGIIFIFQQASLAGVVVANLA